jgi:hypothetical protein
LLVPMTFIKPAVPDDDGLYLARSKSFAHLRRSASAYGAEVFSEKALTRR